MIEAPLNTKDFKNSTYHTYMEYVPIKSLFDFLIDSSKNNLD
jgi:hypothetical protein